MAAGLTDHIWEIEELLTMVPLTPTKLDRETTLGEAPRQRLLPSRQVFTLAVDLEGGHRLPVECLPSGWRAGSPSVLSNVYPESAVAAS